MKRMNQTGLAWILLACGISVFWGYPIQRNSSDGMLDFKGVYYGARCLLQHQDPYTVGGPLHIYLAEDGAHAYVSEVLQQVLSLNVYLPTAYTFIIPLAVLPWGLAHLLWLFLTAAAYILAAFLIWKIAKSHLPGVFLFLICFLLANSEAIFATGNTAGIAISLCVVAVWCFLEDRFVPAGILCLAVSLAIKPHDTGMVWLYFLLAGGSYRKRALQTLVVAAALGLPAIFWISHIAPHWVWEWQSNLLAQSAPGGACDPGPNTPNSGSGPSMIINLQSAVYMFSHNPRIYNLVSYLVCGSLMLIWSYRTLWARLSRRTAWLALAAIVPLNVLMTYHRPYDAKLLLLAFPACAMLWAEGGSVRWVALLLNIAGIASTADIPLTVLWVYTRNLRISTTGMYGQIENVLLTRPVPLILLLMGIFYLWVYLRWEPEKG